MRYRRLLLGALSLLAVSASAGCGGNQESTQISTVVPHHNPKVHQRVLRALARQRARVAERRARVARANAGTPRVIAFWDTERGLVGTGSDQYPRDDRYCTGTISLTTDGGHSFQVVRRTPGIVGWVDTAGTQDAWAQVFKCGKVRRRVRRQILHTSDGGQSWDRLPAGHEGSGVGIWRPSFASATQGLASVASGGQDARLIADTARVLATSDGGRSWHSARRPCRHSDGVAVSFPSPAAAWAVCTQTLGAGGQDKIVLTSTDGGQGWQRVAHVALEHPHDAGLFEGGYVRGLSFSEDGTGVLFDDVGGLYRTQDGGHQWQPVSPASFPAPPNAHAHGHGSIMSFVTPLPTTEFGLFSYDEGDDGWQLASSTDGGRSWTVVHRRPVPKLWG